MLLLRLESGFYVANVRVAQREVLAQMVEARPIPYPMVLDLTALWVLAAKALTGSFPTRHG